MLPNNLEYKILINYTLSQHVQYELGKKLLKPAYQNTVQKLKSLKGYVGRYIVLGLR